MAGKSCEIKYFFTKILFFSIFLRFFIFQENMEETPIVKVDTSTLILPWSLLFDKLVTLTTLRVLPWSNIYCPDYLSYHPDHKPVH